jgi:hypothetical protein
MVVRFQQHFIDIGKIFRTVYLCLFLDFINPICSDVDMACRDGIEVSQINPKRLENLNDERDIFEGVDAVVRLLKQPSFADSEFKTLLADFDAAFLGIFPDFVDKVNEHMKPEHRLTMPSEGELSTELRILALIRMGITKRPKIAKVLNMSVNTVYSYHCNLRKHSLHPDSPFDEIIGTL